MLNGKAHLLRDDYCDGLGNCLPACPQDAIRFIIREAAPFDEDAVKRHQRRKTAGVPRRAGCPGQTARTLPPASKSARHASSGESKLRQWPVQIQLVPANAPYFEDADLLIAADCAAYANGAFHDEFMDGKVTVIGCPKLDDADYAAKLAEILKNSQVRSVTVARMEVPCCGGIEAAAVKAIEASGRHIPLEVVTIATDGSIKSRTKQ